MVAMLRFNSRASSTRVIVSGVGDPLFYGLLE
jgi:hypothetical protein